MPCPTCGSRAHAAADCHTLIHERYTHARKVGNALADYAHAIEREVSERQRTQAYGRAPKRTDDVLNRVPL